MRATGFRDIRQIIRMAGCRDTHQRIRITGRARGALLQKPVSVRGKPVSMRDKPASARDRSDVISGRA